MSDQLQAKFGSGQAVCAVGFSMSIWCSVGFCISTALVNFAHLDQDFKTGRGLQAEKCRLEVKVASLEVSLLTLHAHSTPTTTIPRACSWHLLQLVSETPKTCV